MKLSSKMLVAIMTFGLFTTSACKSKKPPSPPPVEETQEQKDQKNFCKTTQLILDNIQNTEKIKGDKLEGGILSYEVKPEAMYAYGERCFIMELFGNTYTAYFDESQHKTGKQKVDWIAECTGLEAKFSEDKYDNKWFFFRDPITLSVYEKKKNGEVRLTIMYSSF